MRRVTKTCLVAVLLAGASWMLGSTANAGTPQAVTYCSISSPPSVDPDNAPPLFDMEFLAGELQWSYVNNIATPAHSYKIKIFDGPNYYYAEVIEECTGDEELDYGYYMNALGYCYWEGVVQERIRDYTGNLSNPDTCMDYLRKVNYRGHIWDSYMQEFTSAGPDGATGPVKMNILYWPVWYTPNSTNTTQTSGTFTLNWGAWDPFAPLNVPLSSQNYMLMHWEAP